MAQRVKAYISDIQTAEAPLRPGSFCYWDVDAAVDEARRILTETEPDARPACDHPPVRVRFAHGQRARSIRHWTPRQDVRWEAERALAEALAAFVGEGEDGQ